MIVAELIGKFKGSKDADFSLQGESIHGLVNINENNFSSTNAIFKNTTFYDQVTISGLSNVHQLSFIECTFVQGLTFDNCIFDHDLPDVSNGSIWIEKGTISGKLTFKDSTIKHGIKLSHIAAISILEVVGTTLSKGLFYVDAIGEFHSITLKNSYFLAGFKINGCKKIKNSVEVLNINGHSFSVTDCDFQDNLLIWKARFKGSLVFNDFDISGNVKIEAVYTGSLSMYRFNCERSVKIEFCDFTSDPNLLRGFKSLFIDHVFVKEGIYINQFSGYDYNRLKVNQITINLTMVQAPDIVMGNFDVFELKFTGINNNNKLSFKKICAKQLVLENFTNNSLLFLANFGASHDFKEKGYSLIKINDSILGNTQFLDFDFSGYDRVEIGSSIISEISTANVKWFEPDSLFIIDSNSSEYPIDRLEKTIEVYRQLKLAMNEHDNRRQALVFQSYEYKYYKKLVDSEDYKSKNKIGDQLSLLAGWTNDFGQNWLKPLGLMTLFVGALNLIIIFLARKEGYNENDTCIFCQTIFYSGREFVLLLNPVHSLGDVFESKKFGLNGPIYILDFIQRILTGFFIVQIVSAFRKYFKN